MTIKKAAVLAAVLCAAAIPASAAEVCDVYSRNGMVSAAHELASRAGVEILQKGGNAVDAAVATALALNVAEFNASGMGGGGFMTIYLPKEKRALCLDYRETAPASATADMFASEQAKKEKWSAYGGRSVAVPGFLKGMDFALKRYGTMTFAQVAAPALTLAEEGFVLTQEQKGFISDSFERLLDFNETEDLPFLDEIGLPLEAGDVLKQPGLAKTLRLVAEKGVDVFYRGEIAEAICQAVEKTGGSLTREDLAAYGVEVRAPAEGTYRGYRILSVPPSSSGGAHVIQLLNIMETFDVKGKGLLSPETLRFYAEASKRVFADRERYMADPAFTKVPLRGILSKAYARTLAEAVARPGVARPAAGDPWKFEMDAPVSFTGGLGGEHFSTTSFSVADQQGMIVTATNTINHFMGSSVIVPGWGILLNDEMDDFSPDPESVNAPGPGKRPLSSMCPTVVLDPEGRPFMSIGAAGSTRIITALAHCIMNVVDGGMTMDGAIEAPRFHCQEGAVIRTEKDRYDEALLDQLKAAGYEVSLQTPLYTGGVQGILFNWEGRGADRFLNGGADSRRLGVPVGF